MKISARYSGICSECGERWPPGERIKTQSPIQTTDRPEWIHDQCPDPTASRHPVCQTCWLTHPEGELT